MLKRIICITTALLMLICMGCKSEQDMPTVVSVSQSSAFPITINGTTFDASPEKVVSLSPFITDMIYAVGAQDKLAGVCDYCEGESADTVGSSISPDTDAIIQSGAQLLLTQTPLDSDDKNALENAGITVMELKSPVSLETLENLYASMIAVLCGSADFQSQAQSTFTSVHDAVANAGKSEKNVVCIISKHMNTAGSDTLCGDLISQLANNAVSEDGYGNVLDSQTAQSADVIFADVSLENTDISQLTGDTPVFYIDFSALENPNAENLCNLIAQMCENL